MRKLAGESNGLTARRRSAVAALLCTVAACAAVIVSGLGVGDRRTDARELAARDSAVGVVADARTLSPTYPWPAFFSIAGNGKRSDAAGGGRAGGERAIEPSTPPTAEDASGDGSSPGPDRDESPSTSSPVKRRSARSPARVEVRGGAPRSEPVGDRPSRRRRPRDERSPQSAPVPVQVPVPRAAPLPPAEQAPPAEPLEGEEPPEGGKPPKGEAPPKQGKPPEPGGGKPPREGRDDQR